MYTTDKIVTGAFVVALIGAALAGMIKSCREHPAPPSAPDENSVAEAAPCVTWPHALVPCGVHSMSEVEQARDHDALLREHYADLGTLKPAILRSDEYDYASFRQGAGIVWTSRPVLVKTGELVLEDRVGNKVRSRCGNLLSAVPRRPMAMPPEMEREVPTVAYPDDMPVLPPLSVERELLPVSPPPISPPPEDELPVSPGRPLLIPPVGIAAVPATYFFPPFVVVARSPVMQGTPEPGTWVLLAPAIVVMGIFREYRRVFRK
jgi:hypothetical protein